MLVDDSVQIIINWITEKLNTLPLNKENNILRERMKSLVKLHEVLKEKDAVVNDHINFLNSSNKFFNSELTKIYDKVVKSDEVDKLN